MVEIKQLPLGPLQTNCYILACQETRQAAVIDPSADGRSIAATLDEGMHDLTHILLTHTHFDHIGGLAQLKQAYPQVPVYCHPEAAPLMDQAAQQAAFFGIDQQVPPPYDQPLAAGDVLHVGNIKLDVLYTPGHAPGHVSFHAAAYRVIFSGDVLFQGSIGRTDLPGANHQQLMDVIRDQFLILNDDTQVLSGHGPVTTIGRERQSNPFLFDLANE